MKVKPLLLGILSFSCYFNVFSQSPGGASNTTIWYKADSGVTQAGASVETVIDQSGSGSNLSQSNTTRRPINSNLMNFNPTFTFDGTSDRLPIQNKNYTSSDNLNQVYVWTVYATSFSDLSQSSNSYDSRNWAFLDFDRSEWFNTSVGGDGTLGFYYHPSGSSIVDVKATTITNNGLPNIGGFVFNLNEINETTIRLNGSIEVNDDFTNTALGSNNTRYGYVGDGSEASSFDSRANNRYYSGDISEIIYFENTVLAPSKIESIESYLAFKYGITLIQSTPTNYYASDWNGTSGTVIWSAVDNTSFNNDIAGIGLDNESALDQRISKSQNTDALVTFALENDFASANNASARTITHASDLSFMTWANNDNAIEWSNSGSTACENQILSRVWKIDETGTVGNVHISIPDDSSTVLTKLPEDSGSVYLVTKEGDSDFTIGATVTELTLNGTNWELPVGFDFTDGMYFTFETLRPTKNAIGTNWATETDWSPVGVPANSDNVIIPLGIDMVVDGVTAEANNISVEPGASLIVNTAATVETSCGLFLNSNSTSYSSLILDGTITGDVVYKRHVNIAAGAGNSTTANDLVSAPLNGQTFGDFRAQNSNILSGAIGGNPAFLFGPFDSSSEVYVNYGLSDDVSTLDVGVGYRTGSTDNGTYTFKGTVEKGIVTSPLVTGGDIIWNLIGNPYPSYLNVQEFLNDTNNQQIINSGDTFGIYGYDGAALDGWTIYNLANTTATTAITPGQGFFIATEPGVLGNITFMPSMRRVGRTDDFIVGRNISTSEFTFIKLKAASTTSSYKTEFYFNDNATRGLDVGYDSKLWNGIIPDFALYSHLVEDNDNNPMAIQSFSDSDFQHLTIPLGVNAQQGEILTFSIEEMNLPEGTKVYLQDVLNNTTTELNIMDYVINPISDIEGTGRFYLNISNTTLSNTENSIDKLELFNNPKSQTLILKGLLNFNAQLTLYDVQGRLVEIKDLKTNVFSQNIEFNNLNSGIYVAKIDGNNKSLTQKVIFSTNSF